MNATGRNGPDETVHSTISRAGTERIELYATHTSHRIIIVHHMEKPTVGTSRQVKAIHVETNYQNKSSGKTVHKDH